MDPGLSLASIELLEPVNLNLNIKRNLSVGWYQDMAAVEVNGDLKPMKVGPAGGAVIKVAFSL